MSKFTQKAIMNAFMDLLKSKSLDKITVKDIIEVTEINRNTFYYYFDNIYSLMDAIFEDESRRFHEGYQENSSFYDEYSRMAMIVMQNRQAMIHIYKSRSRDSLEKYVENSVKDIVSTFVAKAAEGTGLSPEGAQYITMFYSYAIIGATMRWIEDGLTEYKEDILLTISQSFEATIHDMINDYISNHQK